MAPLPTAEADAPKSDQPETADRPSPVLKTRKMSHKEAATKAPAITAAKKCPTNTPHLW